MIPFAETKRVSCTQCHGERWFPVDKQLPDPFICALCVQRNEIREGLARPTPRPAA